MSAVLCDLFSIKCYLISQRGVGVKFIEANRNWRRLKQVGARDSIRQGCRVIRMQESYAYNICEGLTKLNSQHVFITNMALL